MTPPNVIFVPTPAPTLLYLLEGTLMTNVSTVGARTASSTVTFTPDDGYTNPSNFVARSDFGGQVRILSSTFASALNSGAISFTSFVLEINGTQHQVSNPMSLSAPDSNLIFIGTFSTLTTAPRAGDTFKFYVYG